MDTLRGPVPALSWTGEEDLARKEELHALEAYLGNGAITTSTYQKAIQLCCEVLGSRAYLTPVLLPITASLETFTGVFASGALPVLLDVEPGTLYIAPDALKEALDELGQAVVVLERVGGYAVPEEVLEAVMDVPTIACTRRVPHTDTGKLGLCATFNVFDLNEVIGAGGVIYHAQEPTRRQLLQLRGGVLGHRAWLTEDQARTARQRLEHLNIRAHTYETVVKTFSQGLQDRHIPDILPWVTSELPGPAIFQVPNAPHMVRYLQTCNIPVRHVAYPLYRIPEVANRFQSELREYPGSEISENRLIMLPTHAGIEKLVPHILDKMSEALDG